MNGTPKMNGTPQKPDREMARLEKALLENDKLMREAAIKYEDLVAAKEDLSAAVKAHKLARAKSAVRK